jgi:hypothetical protein
MSPTLISVHATWNASAISVMTQQLGGHCKAGYVIVLFYREQHARLLSPLVSPESLFCLCRPVSRRKVLIVDYVP